MVLDLLDAAATEEQRPLLPYARLLETWFPQTPTEQLFAGAAYLREQFTRPEVLNASEFNPALAAEHGPVLAALLRPPAG